MEFKTLDSDDLPDFPNWTDLPLLPQLIEIASSDSDVDVEGSQSTLDRTCTQIHFDPEAE